MTTATNTKLAWCVEDEEGADIVFAKDEDTAKQIGASKFWSKAEYISAERAPQWNQFAELGYVPAKDLIEDGWRLTCHYCDKDVDSDEWDYDSDTRLHLVYDCKVVFCSQSCHDQHHHERDVAKVRMSQAKAILLSKYPGIYDLRVHSSGSNYPTYANFNAPGCQYRIEWASNDPHVVYVVQADQSAWAEFKRSVSNPA
jgi:hypothetical protein